MTRLQLYAANPFAKLSRGTDWTSLAKRPQQSYSRDRVLDPHSQPAVPQPARKARPTAHAL